MSINQIEVFQQKEFLCKDSMYSSSMIHTKLYPDGRAMVRISDCNGSIRLWNPFINDPIGQKEMFEKIDTLINHLTNYKQQLENVAESEK